MRPRSLGRRSPFHTMRAVRPSPEWGCGGVYGLLYNGSTLYYTTAFDAAAYFHDRWSGETLVYGYELLGPPPRSGGDTYNASTWVNETIYFGGWLHAPAARRGNEVDFRSKRSHIHSYNEAEREVRLIWSSGIAHPTMWAGEVTSLAYNPLRGTLIAARGDGHRELGVYEVDPATGEAKKVSGVRVLRTALYMDMHCHSLHHGWGGAPGAHCLRLEDNKPEATIEITDTAAASADGGPAPTYRSGDIAPAYTRLQVYARGGVYTLDPLGGDPPVYHRLLDLGHAPVGPLRSNTLQVAGAPLAAYNAQPHSTVRGTPELPREQQRASRSPPAPTLLVHHTAPAPRIVAVLGARATSLAVMEDRLLAATATCPNLERYDATTLDHSSRDITQLPLSTLATGNPPPVAIELQAWMLPEDRPWGGIPLTGYHRAELTITAKRGGTLTIHGYSLNTPPQGADSDRVSLQPGRNPVDLATASTRAPIASFTLKGLRKGDRITITLS